MKHHGDIATLLKISKDTAARIKCGDMSDIKPCLKGKEGQVVQLLNCAACGYAHYRFVDDYAINPS